MTMIAAAMARRAAAGPNVVSSRKESKTRPGAKKILARVLIIDNEGFVVICSVGGGGGGWNAVAAGMVMVGPGDCSERTRVTPSSRQNRKASAYVRLHVGQIFI